VTDPTAAQWTRFVALGDSITEGWCDPVVGPGEPWFGWADRLAHEIDGHQRARHPNARRLEFANLAVRGRRIRHVVEEQVPSAIAMRADLVSVLIGGNDLSAVRVDPDALAAHLETGVAQLARSGATVLLATAYDPGFSRYLRMLRGRAAVFTANVHAIAARHGCLVLDLWTIPGLAEPGMWSEDRVHPSTRGHLALLFAASKVLRLPDPVHPSEIDDGDRLPNSVWFRRHALPWLARRVRQVSSGDGRGPKLPQPTPVAFPREHPAADDGPTPRLDSRDGIEPGSAGLDRLRDDRTRPFRR
jgi:lysophospholipase L1-like esterase